MTNMSGFYPLKGDGLAGATAPVCPGHLSQPCFIHSAGLDERDNGMSNHGNVISIDHGFVSES